VRTAIPISSIDDALEVIQVKILLGGLSGVRLNFL